MEKMWELLGHLRLSLQEAAAREQLFYRSGVLAVAVAAGCILLGHAIYARRYAKTVAAYKKRKMADDGLVTHPMHMTLSGGMPGKNMLTEMDVRAYGDELLYDPRLKDKYRKLKQTWLQGGKRLFKRLGSSGRLSEANIDKRRHRKLSDGLESIYSPMGLPVDTQASLPGLRRDISAGSSGSTGGVRLIEDGAFAFKSIVNRWKVWGARDMPVLIHMCQAATCVELRDGETLFEQGKPLEKSLYILKDGEVEFLVKSLDGQEKQEVLQVVGDEGTILAGIMDFIALMCGEGAVYCASARARGAAKVIKVPVDTDAWFNTNKVGVHSRCRLLRSCALRSHRVTVLTAYSYLGIILDAYPEHPTVPLPASLNDVGKVKHLTPEHQDILKKLIRAVLALNNDFQIDDLERCSSLPPSPPSGGGKTKYTSLTRGDSLPTLAMAGGGPDSPVVDEDSGNTQHIKILQLREGDLLTDVDHSRTSMHIVLCGELSISRNEGPRNDSIFADDTGLKKAAKCGPGTVFGYGIVLTGSPDEWFMSQGPQRPALLKVSASKETWLLQVQQPFIEHAINVNGLTTINFVAQKILRAIPPILRLVDLGVKFKQLGAGQVLVNEGDRTDGSLFVLLYGRCRSSVKVGDKVEVLDDHGRGTLVGETEAFTGGCHKATVQAVRYTSFAVIPRSVLRLLVRRHPAVLASLAEHVMDKAAKGRPHGAPCHHSTPTAAEKDHRAVVGSGDAKTVLVLPVSTSVPLDLFCSRLESALTNSCHTVRTVTSSSASSLLGADEPISFSDDLDLLLLENWLTQQEEQHEIVLYKGDWQDSPWNRLAMAMSDVVLLVANFADGPQLSYLEQELDQQMRNAQKLLVCLHVNPKPGYTPSGTRLWVEKRHGINEHYHIRLHTQSPSYDQAHIRSDFMRLARILTSNAIGLVLGGGGARGMAHLGVIRALEEHGIPIDMVAGVSIGAFVGGLYATTGSYLDMVPKAHRFARKMSSVWMFLQDMTLPMTSWFNGYNFGRSLEAALGDTKIEDTWLTYACLSVDLSISTKKVHRNGSLWRYVRASMTLANILPPLCDVDPKDDTVHYLVDGGYISNLPVEECRKMGAATIIACDIGADIRLTGTADYGDTLSGMQALWSKKAKGPSMSEVSGQLMFIRSVESLAMSKEITDFYLQPPVTHFSIVSDFGKYPEVQTLGYEYTKERLTAWKDSMKSRAPRARVRTQSRGMDAAEMKRGVSLTALDTLQGDTLKSMRE